MSHFSLGPVSVEYCDRLNDSWEVYEIPSKLALIKYVLECASDVGCCMKHAKTIRDSQKTIRFLIAHAWAFCGVGIVLA